MRDSYIILKFGTHRVLLLSHDSNPPATMTRHVNGDWTTFDYSPCEVVGSVNVESNEQEPTLAEILASTRRFHAECDGKISNALLSAGCLLALPDGNQLDL